jgi:hypothetical protein
MGDGTVGKTRMRLGHGSDKSDRPHHTSWVLTQRAHEIGHFVGYQAWDMKWIFPVSFTEKIYIRR